MNTNTTLTLIGDTLRNKRKDKGLSTKDLSNLLSISSGLINNIENAKCDSFNIELLTKLSITLNFDFFKLLSNNYNCNFHEDILINEKLLIILNEFKNLLESQYSTEHLIILLDKISSELTHFKLLLSTLQNKN